MNPLPHGQPLKARLTRLRDEHHLLGQAYRKGRDAYLAAGSDPRTGAAAVTGIDHATSE